MGKGVLYFSFFPYNSSDDVKIAINMHENIQNNPWLTRSKAFYARNANWFRNKLAGGAEMFVIVLKTDRSGSHSAGASGHLRCSGDECDWWLAAARWTAPNSMQSIFSPYFHVRHHLVDWVWCGAAFLLHKHQKVSLDKIRFQIDVGCTYVPLTLFLLGTLEF